MTLNEYQKAALRTINTELSHREALAVYAMWLCSEAGEVAKQVIRLTTARASGERDAIIAHAREEVGDTLWCVAAMAKLLGCDLDTIADRNKTKLEARWPEGYKG